MVFSLRNSAQFAEKSMKLKKFLPKIKHTKEYFDDENIKYFIMRNKCIKRSKQQVESIINLVHKNFLNFSFSSILTI